MITKDEDVGYPASLRRCANCVIPETQDAVTYDKGGVCSVCKTIDVKRTKVDWPKRKEDFKKILDEFRGKYDYDCIIPYSGGKDSTYQAYTLIRDFKLKPLIVSFDHGFFRPTNLSNTDRTLKKLGADYLKFRPNWHVVKKLMLESLKRKGDFCWHCHTGIYAYPMRIAVKFKIPLIIWGESAAEYMSYYDYENNWEEVDEDRFNKCCNLGITAEDMLGMVNDPSVTERDLLPFAYPSREELKSIHYRSICLGNYMPWDTRKQSDIIKKELGWKGDLKEGVAPEYDYEKVECAFQGVRDYLRFIKRGYGRTAHLTSIDIRNGRMAKEKAIELTRKYDGKRPPSLDLFLKVLGISEKEFNEIAASHSISPYKHDFSKTVKDKKLHDQDEWHIDESGF
ncbi:MAG: N-acetyl sugar amidotransferase [Candidatus Micrarchaeia archaeon]|jgi:N-acetyl sugar amidotransferase